MKAAVMYGLGDVRIEDVPVPRALPGEVVVRVTAAGVCGTDVGEFLYGPRLFSIDAAHRITGHSGPMIPGHEFGGRVVEVGDGVDGFAIGDLIASGAGISCGRCFQCRAGFTNVCVDYWTVGLNRNGGLADFVSVPVSCCLEVESLGVTETAASLAQPMSIGVHSMRRGRPEPGGTVVVVGAGGIGAFLIYALLANGHSVFAIDVDAAKLETPARLGANVTTDSADLPTVRVAYEASGSQAGLRTALAATANGGRTVVVGLQKVDPTLDLYGLSIGERALIGTNAHAFAVDFEPAARLVGDRLRADGHTAWDDFMSDPWTLEALAETVLPAMADRSSTSIKNVFRPG